MANYQSLKTAINAVIKANGNKEITGTVLNEVLLTMVNSLGAGYQFAGVATPSTNPGTPDQKVFYLAYQDGTYINFGGIQLPTGMSVIKWDGTWSFEHDTDSTKNICDTAIGEPFSLISEHTYTSTFIKEDGELFGGTSLYYVDEFDITSYKYVLLYSDAVVNDAVYAYTVKDNNGNVIKHANVNISMKRAFFFKVPEYAVSLFVCNKKYVLGIQNEGYILETIQDILNIIDELVSEIEKYRNLEIQETFENKFIFQGELRDGAYPWNVSKYNLIGLHSLIHLYSNSAINESVYAYTVQDKNGVPLVWATEPVGEQREYIVDLADYPNAAYLYVGNPLYVEGMTKGVIPIMEERIDALEENVVDKEYYFTKNNIILWLGTSIPEGAQYPEKSSKKCGYECINNAYGGSQLCWTGVRPLDVNIYSGRCLTATVAELEAMFRQDVTAGTITEETLEAWKNKSYERSVLPYINGVDTRQVSMIVIDHGFNDRLNIHEMLQNIDNIDWLSRDRSNFVGAFNYLMDRIQEIQPTIKLVIAGYFQNKYAPYYSYDVCRMQELVAEHYGISVMKAWEHSQINDAYVAGTNNYIQQYNERYGTSYTKLNPDANGNIMSLQVYCPDEVHPHSDMTGNCNRRLNAVYSKLLADLI